MKLLIVTQIVDLNDPVLGFFHRWIEEFAKHCESIEVICLKEGRHELPNNVQVHSLGKEEPPRFARRLVYARRFLSLIRRLRHNYDSVFVHMNPEYVILGGLQWRRAHKKIEFWYTHKNVDLKLRIATWFAQIIFTASAESFRLKSKKVHVMGHGIDTIFFQPHYSDKDSLRLITVGRISSTKRIHEMIGVLDELQSHNKMFEFVIVGVPITKDDFRYQETLKREIEQKPYKEHIHFRGPIIHGKLPEMLTHSDIFLNLSMTESLDKAVLEALASGLVVISSNKAFLKLLQPRGLYTSSIEPEVLSNIVENAATVNVSTLIEDIKEKHSLEILIRNILAYL